MKQESKQVTDTKHEWRKREKKFYLPKARPEIVSVPKFKYASIRGEGNPNSPFFADFIGVLYAVSYAIKMGPKKGGAIPDGYCDYTVYPLEGIWDLNEEAKAVFDGKINKDDLVFNLMIRQPDFVHEAFFHEMLQFAKEKKPNALLDQIEYQQIEDGKCVQMLHLGSYDNEAKTFEIMEDFARREQLSRLSKIHREIYLSDFRRVPSEKLKTVLRFKVE